MNIHSLELVNFRNYEHANWTFPPHIIVLHGLNGVGKSNLLEALYVSTIGRSFRTNDTQDLLQFGATEAGIIVEFTKRDNETTKYNLKLSGKEKKDIRLNGNRIFTKRISRHLEYRSFQS